jgi:translation initiation factor 2 subunit 3
MTTMISGAAIMDAAILLIDATSKCPQPQTYEHLIALEIMGLKNIIIIQNKLDLVDRNRAMRSKEEIDEFVRGTVAEGAPIIPISAQLGIGIDHVVRRLAAISARGDTNDGVSGDDNAYAHMHIARSFDVNKPGTTHTSLVGGVIGGTLTRGKISVGDTITILPGIYSKALKASVPINARVTSLFSEKNQLDHVVPGGLIGIGTDLDSSTCKADGLCGLVVVSSKSDNLHFNLNISTTIKLKCKLLKRYISSDANESDKIKSLALDEEILLNIGTMSHIAKISSISDGGKIVTFVSTSKEFIYDSTTKATLSRNVLKKWRIIGFGTVFE